MFKSYNIFLLNLGNETVVDRFIHSGADINQAIYNGMNALHLAIQEGCNIYMLVLVQKIKSKFEQKTKIFFR